MSEVQTDLKGAAEVNKVERRTWNVERLPAEVSLQMSDVQTNPKVATEVSNYEPTNNNEQLTTPSCHSILTLFKRPEAPLTIDTLLCATPK